jgi:hypothetical protein
MRWRLAHVVAVLLAVDVWGLGGSALGSSSFVARAHLPEMLVVVRSRRARLSLRQPKFAGCGGALRGGAESEADGGEDESGRYVPGMMQHEVSVPARQRLPLPTAWGRCP